MYNNQKVCVVVPAYKEESQIGMVIETMPDFIDAIVIVDDKSPDGTVEVIQDYLESHKRIVLLEHPVNQGVGGAIATGYIWARDNDMDVAVVMAGDGQMDPNELPIVIEPVANGEIDYSKGNRLRYANSYDMIPKVRYFGNAVLSLLTKIASGYWHVADSQTGYTAISKRALHTVDWRKMYKRYGQPNDLLVTLNVYDFKVRDVPIKPVYNVGEKSGIKIYKVIFTISLLLLKKFLWRLREKYIIKDFHPLIFFYFLGFLMLLASAAFTLRLIVLWIQLGYAPELTAIALMFSITLGLQSTFFAMWFDMEANKHLR
ncbi:MAG: glycosyltransferase family 2 protein [Cyanobacteria bacterium J06650_10]